MQSKYMGLIVWYRISEFGLARLLVLSFDSFVSFIGFVIRACKRRSLILVGEGFGLPPLGKRVFRGKDRSIRDRR
jgi:hypothetical protein